MIFMYDFVVVNGPLSRFVYEDPHNWYDSVMCFGFVCWPWVSTYVLIYEEPYGFESVLNFVCGSENRSAFRLRRGAQLEQRRGLSARGLEWSSAHGQRIIALHRLTDDVVFGF